MVRPKLRKASGGPEAPSLSQTKDNHDHLKVHRQIREALRSAAEREDDDDYACMHINKKSPVSNIGVKAVFKILEAVGRHKMDISTLFNFCFSEELISMTEDHHCRKHYGLGIRTSHFYYSTVIKLHLLRLMIPTWLTVPYKITTSSHHERTATSKHI